MGALMSLYLGCGGRLGGRKRKFADFAEVGDNKGLGRLADFDLWI